MRARTSLLLAAIASAALRSVASASPPPEDPPTRSATPEESATYRHPKPVTLEGTVIDEAGAPLAGLTVIACGSSAPCSTLYDAARLSPRSLDDLLADIPVSWPDDSFARTTTDARGRWRATVRGYGMGTSIVAVVTAPGKTVELHGANTPDLAQKAVREITLQPVATLDVAARCTTRPCSDKVVLTVDGPSKLSHIGSSHLERLLPGTYTISVVQGFGNPGEHRGAATVTVKPGRPNKLTVELARVGTGKRITGTARVRAGRDVVRDRLAITARCGPPADDAAQVVRYGSTDANGAFAIEDVGPPPCRVHISSSLAGRRPPDNAASMVTVDALPAEGIVLDGVVDPAAH